MLNQCSHKALLFKVPGTQNRAAFYFCQLVLSAVILIFLPIDLKAQENRVFTVSSVHVDVTSSSSADARKKALASGQLRAFERILRRLVLSDDIDRLPEMKKEDIDEYVRDFTVDNEKKSPVRYIADLTFRFKPRHIRYFLRDLEIEFAETVRKPVLVLPIYEAAAAKALWDNPNPWREAWTELDLNGGLVPLKLAGGDLKDIGTIGAAQAVAGDQAHIRAIGARYDVDTVMVIHAVLSPNLRGRPAIYVKVTSYGSDRRANEMKNKFMLKSEETIDNLLKRVARFTVTTIEDHWKEDNLINFEQVSILAAAIPIQSLKDWVQVRRKLRNIAVIERVDLVLFSRNEARINILYLGEAEQLSLALAQADMKLEHEEGSWMLMLQRSNRRRNWVKP